MYDDYTELQPGAAADFESLLRKYFKFDAPTGEPFDDDMQSTNTSPKGRWNMVQSLWVALKESRKTINLPRHNPAKHPAAGLGVCSSTLETPQSHHNFVLLCIPMMRWASKLWQAEVCRVNSDRDFFRILRHYYEHRGKRPWDKLRKVCAINFVKVNLLHCRNFSSGFCCILTGIIVCLVRDILKPPCRYPDVP